MIKKMLITVSVMLGLFAPALSMQPAFAVDILHPIGSPGACNNAQAATQPDICKDNSAGAASNPIFGPNGILTIVINLLSLIVGIVSVIIIIVEGLRMILAGGDASAAAAARKGITYAVVGLVVALVSQALVATILNKL